MTTELAQDKKFSGKQAFACMADARSQKTVEGLLNVLEPAYLIDTFLKNPPIDFDAFEVNSGTAVATPAFRAAFDLLTTLDDDAKQLKDAVGRFPFLKRFLVYPSVFVGTTATEYSTYPDCANYKSVIANLLQEMRKRGAQLLIVKDIPQNSPLLNSLENEKANLLIEECANAGFLLVEGQALAFVPINFSSIDEFMARLSKSRRKEFRKKLKDSAHVKVRVLDCGAPEFFDEDFLGTIYKMYENVYQQSEIHFDVLSKEFFKGVLQSTAGGGRVFCYEVDGRFIGYNICFVHDNRLIDKYVGFVYPDARDANLYFLSWFYNLEYAIKNNLTCYIAGWTDPAVKASLGASFTMTRHAVFIRNPILRAILTPFKHLFESDSNWMEKQEK